MADDELWNDEEFEAAAEAHLSMLRRQQLGENFKKAEVSRAYRDGPLSGRSKQSFDYRMRNISAVMQEDGRPWLQGYVPAEHVGEPSKKRVRAALARVESREAAEPANEPAPEVEAAPSRGLVPKFGARESQYEDGPSHLYMLVFEGDAAALLGRPVGPRTVVKVGYSNSPDRRCEEHNSTLPPVSATRWRLALTSKAFPSGDEAKAAEDAMKDFARRFQLKSGKP